MRVAPSLGRAVAEAATTSGQNRNGDRVRSIIERRKAVLRLQLRRLVMYKPFRSNSRGKVAGHCRFRSPGQA